MNTPSGKAYSIQTEMPAKQQQQRTNKHSKGQPSGAQPQRRIRSVMGLCQHTLMERMNVWAGTGISLKALLALRTSEPSLEEAEVMYR